MVLRDENDTLQTELQETRASLERVRREERRLSAALKKQAALLSSETNHRGKAAAAAAAAEKDAGPSKDGRSAGDSSSRTASASVWGDTSSTLSSSGAGSTDGDELDSSRSRTAGTEGSAPACSPKPPLSPLAGTPAGEVGAGQGPELPDLLEAARLSLTGTVSGWLKGMQAACSEGLRQALVLPWLLHKLFYLSTELIDERREELLNIFVGGGAAAAAEGAREEESAYMLRHLRRHYRTVFPLSGANLRAAVHNVMMALAHRCVGVSGFEIVNRAYAHQLRLYRCNGGATFRAFLRTTSEVSIRTRQAATHISVLTCTTPPLGMSCCCMLACTSRLSSFWAAYVEYFLKGWECVLILVLSTIYRLKTRSDRRWFTCFFLPSCSLLRMDRLRIIRYYGMLKTRKSKEGLKPYRVRKLFRERARGDHGVQIYRRSRKIFHPTSVFLDAFQGPTT